MIGTVVGSRYRIDASIGAGGMQNVMLAFDLTLERNVALKFPKNASAAKRFKRSALVSAKVNHPNVAKTLDYFFDSNEYLVEEFCDGLDLGQIIKKVVPFFDPLFAAFVFHRLAKAVAASHHVDVVHRDLKPSNIMAIGGPRLSDFKITDFGIAKLAEDELGTAIEGGDETITSSGTALGAIPYMSPEMIDDFGSASKPTDIWSLGAILYELLSGVRPFGSNLKAIRVIGSGRSPDRPAYLDGNSQLKQLGDELFAICLKCLSYKASDRPTADELVGLCEALCYTRADRYFGDLNSMRNTFWGFIKENGGGDVFFHRDNVYGPRISVNDRVWYSRFDGGKAPRAFPIIKC